MAALAVVTHSCCFDYLEAKQKQKHRLHLRNSLTSSIEDLYHFNASPTATLKECFSDGAFISLLCNKWICPASLEHTHMHLVLWTAERRKLDIEHEGSDTELETLTNIKRIVASIHHSNWRLLRWPHATDRVSDEEPIWTTWRVCSVSSPTTACYKDSLHSANPKTKPKVHVLHGRSNLI